MVTCVERSVDYLVTAGSRVRPGVATTSVSWCVLRPVSHVLSSVSNSVHTSSVTTPAVTRVNRNHALNHVTRCSDVDMDVLVSVVNHVLTSAEFVTRKHLRACSFLERKMRRMQHLFS